MNAVIKAFVDIETLGRPGTWKWRNEKTDNKEHVLEGKRNMTGVKKVKD